MAFSVRVEGISRETKQATFSHNFYWWNGRELLDDERFEDVSENPSYIDLVANLSLEEMRVLYEPYKGMAESPYYASEELQELEAALNSSADRYSHFRVTVFEWESCLG